MTPIDQWQAVILPREFVPYVFLGEGPFHFIVTWNGTTLVVALNPETEAVPPPADTWTVGVSLNMEAGLVYVFPPGERAAESRSPEWTRRVNHIAGYLHLFASFAPPTRDWILLVATMLRGGQRFDPEITHRDLARIVWIGFALIPWILGTSADVPETWRVWLRQYRLTTRPMPPMMSIEAFFAPEELTRGVLFFEDRYVSLRLPHRAFFSVRTQEHAPDEDTRLSWKGTWDELSSGVYISVVRHEPAQVQPFILGAIEERHQRSLDWVTQALGILLQAGHLNDPDEACIEDRALAAHTAYEHLNRYPVKLTEQVIRATLRAIRFGGLWPEWIAANQPTEITETVNEA